MNGEINKNVQNSTQVNEVVEQNTTQVNEEVRQNNGFVNNSQLVEKKPKNKIGIIILIVVIIILLLVGGYFLFRKLNERTVTFVDDDGSVISSVVLQKGDLVVKPSNPEKKNCEFLGWESSNGIFNFNDKIVEDIKLKATYKYFYEVSFTEEDGTALYETQIIEKGNMVEKPENPSKPANDFLGWTLDDTDYDFSIPVNRDTKLVASWRTYKLLDFHPFSLQCSIEEKTDYGISYKDITKMKLNQNFVCMVWFSAEEYNYKGYDRVKNYNYNLEFGDGLKLLSKKGVTKTDGQRQIIDIKSHDSNVLVGKEYYYFKMQSTDISKLYVRVKDIKVTTATDNYYSVGDMIKDDLTISFQ